LPGAGAVDMDITGLRVIIGRERAVERIVGMGGDANGWHGGEHNEGMIETAVGATQLNQVARYQLLHRHTPSVGTDRAVIDQKVI